MSRSSRKSHQQPILPHDQQLAIMAERMRAIRARQSTHAPPAPRPAPPPPAEVDWDAMYTLEQVAERMQVSLPTLREWGIPCFQIGRTIRIHARDLWAFVASHTTPPSPGRLCTCRTHKPLVLAAGSPLPWNPAAGPPTWKLTV